jgi:FkbM family methyltransferase
VVALIRKLVRRLGVDVIRYPHGTGYGVALATALRQAATLVDVGANVGQFALQARRLGFTGPIISFEPASATYRRLSRAVAADADWSAVQLAIGDEEGEAALRLPRDSSLASFLPWTSRGARLWQDDGSTEVVDIVRLDTALAPLGLERPIFLKIDTQGFDRRVLEGATATLAGVHALLVELPVRPLYEDAGDWLETLGWLRERGFYPRWFEPIQVIESALAEVDCLLVRVT